MNLSKLSLTVLSSIVFLATAPTAADIIDPSTMTCFQVKTVEAAENVFNDLGDYREMTPLTVSTGYSDQNPEELDGGPLTVSFHGATSTHTNDNGCPLQADLQDQDFSSSDSYVLPETYALHSSPSRQIEEETPVVLATNESGLPNNAMGYRGFYPMVTNVLAKTLTMCKYTTEVGKTPDEIHCFSKDPSDVLAEIK